MSSVGWGIIGCGDVVERKAGNSFQEVANSRLVAVMRRTAEKAEEFARQRNVPFWTTKAEDVIQHPDVDAIYVATPPDHHLEYALAVCAAGKPCVVEKPAGRSAEECGRMVEAFRAAGVPLYVSYYRRYLPKYRKVKEIIDSGRLGTIVSIDYRLSMPPPTDNWRLTPQVSGGGLFHDLSGHVLDLFDYWFGAIELVGASAVNLVPAHESEDAVAMSIRTPDGAVGTAVWNFAAPRSVDTLTIEGLWGQMSLECLDGWSPVHVEISGKRTKIPKQSLTLRSVRKLKGKKKLPKWVKEELGFPPMAYPQRPMIETIVKELANGGGGTDSAEAALRSSRLMDRALQSYYGGREGAFWDRPFSWDSLRAKAARPIDKETRREYELTDQQVQFFGDEGYLGPFKCEARNWDRINIPEDDRLSLHLRDPAVFEVCSHPSIVCRVAQILGVQGVSLFKSRIWVKSRESSTIVPWHQDVGRDNGGFLPNGEPVPTITAWLALSEASRESGAVKVLSGSHRRFFGEYWNNINADLLATGALDDVDLNDAVDLVAKPGEFYLFHSWTLHGSPPNTSSQKRKGLNMRFVALGQEVEPQFEYLPLQSGPEYYEIQRTGEPLSRAR